MRKSFLKLYDDVKNKAWRSVHRVVLGKLRTGEKITTCPSIQKTTSYITAKTCFTNPSHFLSLCILDSAGKILQRIIYRVDRKIHNQSGEPSKDTGRNSYLWKGDPIHCRIVVTLDLRNAFNSASWHSKLTALNNLSSLHLQNNGRLFRGKTFSYITR